jgi:hypothetical protein
MPTPYDPQRHPSPPWEWVDDPEWGAGNGYWKLADSEGTPGQAGPHNFECVQYTLAKVQGRRPHHSDPTETSAAEAEFLRLGFQPVDCGRCGCGQGQCRQCVIIYYIDPQRQESFHVAAFDPVLCDWGGKLSALGPIVRFKNPEDYKKPQETMRCWCRESSDSYISDEEINKGALTGVEETRSLLAAFLRWLRELFRRIADWF